MALSDSAFLWETEVLRETRRASPPPSSRQGVLDDEEWMTLREASQATGVPTSTIRKWARHDNIPSFLERTPSGQLRIVSLSGIRRWAGVIGRELDSSVEPETRQPGDTTEIDLTAPDGPDEPEEVPEGSMLVPLDAWNRMLNQLGNLHEAGQQLAEARERAAKAETEAAFLRERLRELREENRSQPGATVQPAEPTEPTSPPRTAFLLRKIYRDWRRSRRS
jgi:hypothetical protein